MHVETLSFASLGDRLPKKFPVETKISIGDVTAAYFRHSLEEFTCEASLLLLLFLFVCLLACLLAFKEVYIYL